MTAIAPDRRYIWHHVNAGVRVFDLPVPREVTFADTDPADLAVHIRVNGPLDVDAWAAWLDFPSRTTDTGTTAYGVRYGWQWRVCCYTTADLIAALLSPDEEALP